MIQHKSRNIGGLFKVNCGAMDGDLKGNFAICYMLAKYVPGDIKYIFTKFYRHISTNNEANRKFVILISNFSTSL